MVLAPGRASNSAGRCHAVGREKSLSRVVSVVAGGLFLWLVLALGHGVETNRPQRSKNLFVLLGRTVLSVNVEVVGKRRRGLVRLCRLNGVDHVDGNTRFPRQIEQTALLLLIGHHAGGELALDLLLRLRLKQLEGWLKIKRDVWRALRQRLPQDIDAEKRPHVSLLVSFCAQVISLNTTTEVRLDIVEPRSRVHRLRLLKGFRDGA